MFARVTSLRYWKSERPDITTCEDALRADGRRGLFCVADGAGTTLFSNIWADILVEQFIRSPLMSSDPFEMEWWIRQAQKRYRDRVPTSDKLGWNARQKAVEQGAYSTLATLRFTRAEARSATAQLLVVGDSCAIVGHPAPTQQHILPFPLQRAEDFNRAPYCVPSLLKNLNRYMLYPKMDEVTLVPGDIVILATDAVARWIISGKGTGNEQLAWEAFHEIAQKTESNWPAFINQCRVSQTMVDDDSTVIIISLQEAGTEEEKLIAAAGPSQETVVQRAEEFKKARDEHNKELIAIIYGDGQMLNGAGISLATEEKTKARDVADALRDLLQGMRDAANAPNFVSRVEPLWQRHAELLLDEPCAETIRKSLAQQGVHLQPTNLSSIQTIMVDPQGGKSLPNLDPLDLPPGSILMTTGTDRDAGQAGALYHKPAGSEPENALVFTPSIVPIRLYAHEQRQKALQDLRQALQTGDPHKIRAVYDPVLESSLTPDELDQLRAAWQQLKTELTNRLRDAFDQHDDQAILAVAEVIESAQLEDMLKEYEKRWIQEARVRQAAFDRLLHALAEGTAHEKVEAWQSFSQNPKNLKETDTRQLVLAQNLLTALSTGRVDDICTAYDAIEFSPLRKHFLFTEEDLHRLRKAQEEKTALKWFRMVLEKGATLVQTITLSRQLLSPHIDLSQDELYYIKKAESFLRLCQSPQQAQQVKDEGLLRLIYLYDELYYSPYQFIFTKSEIDLVNRIRESAGAAAPVIMTVNGVPVNIEQFQALYRVKPLYARFLIATSQRRLAMNMPDAERQWLAAQIAFWQKTIVPGHLPETTLHDLINHALVEQQTGEEIAHGYTRRNKVSLDREPRTRTEELVRDVSAFAAKDVQLSRDLPSEKELRDVLRHYALFEVFDRYLKEASPAQTLEDRLRERKNTAAILYYEHPGLQSATTTEQQRCWLFKWWFIRRAYGVSVPGGGA